MLIVHTQTKPPCWDRLQKAFGVNWIPGVFCTYGAEIYCHDQTIPDEFLVHEAVHVKQQEGKDPDELVTKYIEDTEYRSEVELAAYRVHNEYLRATVTDESELFVKLHRNVKAFARITGLTHDQADILLSFHAKPIFQKS